MSELATFARPYARAAFAYASEHAAVDEWDRQLAALCTALADQRLAAAGLSEDRLADALVQVCEGLLSEPVVNFVRTLARQRRVTLLAEILALFRSEAATGQAAVAEVRSAHPLDEAERESLRARLETPFGQPIGAVALSVDPSLRGGVVVRVADMCLDLSLRGRMDRLRASLIPSATA